MTMKLHPEVVFPEEVLSLNDVPSHKEYQEQLKNAATVNDELLARKEYADKFSTFVRSCVEGTVVCEADQGNDASRGDTSN